VVPLPLLLLLLLLLLVMMMMMLLQAVLEFRLTRGPERWRNIYKALLVSG
jgi:hypothetical protein